MGKGQRTASPTSNGLFSRKAMEIMGKELTLLLDKQEEPINNNQYRQKRKGL